VKNEVWIGLVEVRPNEGTDELDADAGAFSNVLARAESPANYRDKVTQALFGRDLAVVGIDDLEPLQIRMSRVVVSEENVDLGRQALEGGVVWGSFLLVPDDEIGSLSS
jgi:hypothetical protein